MKDWVRIIDVMGRRFAVMMFKPMDIDCHVVEVFFKADAKSEPQVWHEDYDSVIEAEERYWEIGADECEAIVRYFTESEWELTEDKQQLN